MASAAVVVVVASAEARSSPVMPSLDSPNQVQELLGLLRKRMWTILLPVMYLGTLGVVIATFLPRKYESETTINIKPTRIEEGGLVSRDAPQTDTQREIPNAEYQVKQPKRIREIIQANLTDWPEFTGMGQAAQESFIDSIRDNISVAVLVNPNEKSQGSTFIDVSYMDTVPRRAPTFLRELSKRWVEDVYYAMVTQQRNIAQMSRDQVADTDKALGKIQETMRQIEDAEGISILSITDNRSNRDGDLIQIRPDELEQQRLRVLGEIESGQAALDKAVELYAVIEPRTQGPPPSVPEAFTTQVQLLQLKISQAESDLFKVKPASPEYRKFERKIAEAEQALLDSKEQYAATVPEAEMVENPERLKLADRINALEIEVARKEQERVVVIEQHAQAIVTRSSRNDALRQLIELEEERLDLIEQRKEQRLDLFGANRNISFYETLPKPYEITKEPTLPVGPSFPNVALILGFSIAGGLAIGLGTAFLLEFAKPGYRGTAEVSRSLGLPVLGVVNEITTRGQRNRRRLSRVAIGLSTLALLGSLGWVTWAWINDPRLLGTDFARFLDDLHEKLR